LATSNAARTVCKGPATTSKACRTPGGERRNFNINTELRVSAGSSDPKKTTSFMTMDSTDGSINTTYHFAWKRCT
jgi:hypothetical protein